MKINPKDYKSILEILQHSLDEACRTFGISFEVEEKILYGSQLTKSNPRDIDIFVKVSGIKIVNQEQFLIGYGPSPDKIDADDLMEITYIWLHENQPVYKQTLIDINFRDYDFDLDGKFELLE